MKKFFNTTGPCNAVDHYMIDPIARAGDFATLLEQKACFVIHAPRQSGKTTLLEVLAKKLTKEGKYCALRMSCEMGQPFGDNVGAAELALLERIKIGAENHLHAALQIAQQSRHFAKDVIIRSKGKACYACVVDSIAGIFEATVARPPSARGKCNIES